MIDAVRLQGQRLPVQPDVVDDDPARRDPRGGQLAAQCRWIDGQYPGDRLGIVRDIEPGAEADLEHLTGKISSHAGADHVEVGAAHHLVGDPGQDTLLVEAHRRSMR